jgi:hypothetical protein
MTSARSAISVARCAATRGIGIVPAAGRGALDLLPRAHSLGTPCPAKVGILRRLFADVVESRRRRAEREVARYLARLNE